MRHAAHELLCYYMTIIMGELSCTMDTRSESVCCLAREPVRVDNNATDHRGSFASAMCFDPARNLGAL